MPDRRYAEETAYVRQVERLIENCQGHGRNADALDPVPMDKQRGQGEVCQ